MTSHHLKLALIEGRLAVCRLEPGAAIPGWAWGDGAFVAVTRTRSELSIVCTEAQVPEGIAREGGWRILEVEGPLDFALTGILAALAGPLAKAGISLFAVSTFDTDYVMVKEERLEAAVAALAEAGHRIAPPGPVHS